MAFHRDPGTLVARLIQMHGYMTSERLLAGESRPTAEIFRKRAQTAGNYAAVRRMFKESPARRGTFSDDDIDRYIEALRRPGALSAGLNYYRANSGSGARLAVSARSAAETLVIWGEKDPALVVELLEGLERVASRVRVHRLPNASHWVQNEAPEEVNRVLIGFLRDGH